ncbi:hypothetical protein H2204_000128 [Knufia peltigerae]|uniref:Major facilitator superfamily (MFS) profile domain-containing protein n=1 Tax=Knufia peltigerae TaxID=1002370 RepID=A0AA39D3D4_9EURO|nr:hypothetical protein H2204_000128 [Knufia peltigerae]
MRRSDWHAVTPYMLYCCFVFNAGNVLFGIDVASFGSLQTLPSFLHQFGQLNSKGEYALSTQRKSILNSGEFSLPVEGSCSEKLSIDCVYWIQFCVGRVLAYLAVGIVEPTIPMYQAEMAPAALRGFFAGNVQVLVHLGSIWGAGMSRAYAYEQGKRGWMVPVSMQMIPAVLLLIFTPFCIESPRWLLAHGRKDEALKAMNRVRPRAYEESGRTAREIDAIEQAIAESRSMNQGSWLDLFNRKYLRRTIIVTLMFFFQQTTGQQFANSYGPTFFKSMGLAPDRLFAYSILIPLAGLCGCIIAVLTTDTIGRRTLCYIGAALATMFGALIGSVGSKPGADNNTTDSNVVIASVILLNGVCKLGVASQCWLVGSEIGGIQMRKKLMGWGVAIDVLAAFLVTFFTPYLQAGPHVQLGAKVGYVFMGLAALSFFFFVLFMPELKGRSLEEVDELFERKLWAWQFSKAKTYGTGNQVTLIEDNGQELSVEAGKEQVTAMHVDHAENTQPENSGEKNQDV